GLLPFASAKNSADAVTAGPELGLANAHCDFQRNNEPNGVAIPGRRYNVTAAFIDGASASRFRRHMTARRRTARGRRRGAGDRLRGDHVGLAGGSPWLVLDELADHRYWDCVVRLERHALKMQADRLSRLQIEQIPATAPRPRRAIVRHAPAIHGDDLSWRASLGIEDVPVDAKKGGDIVISAIRTGISDGGHGQIRLGIELCELERRRECSITA